MSFCSPVRKTTLTMSRRIAKDQKSNGKRTGTNRGKRCMRPGPVQRNPYLNFLREYRKRCCGLSAVETVRQGAQAWKALSKDDKVRFILEAYYAPRQRRLTGRRMIKSNRSMVNHRRLGSSRTSRKRRRTSPA